MTNITTTWKSGGVEITVKTTRNDGESDEQWVARHFAEVDEKMQDYPPD